MTDLGFEAYGLRVRVTADDPDALTLLRERLPPFRRSRRSGAVDRAYSLRSSGAGVIVREGRRTVTESRCLEDALHALESDIERWIARHARTRIFVHAGVVTWKGRAVLVPGRSGSGKSTLVAALVRAGARYFSDEFAVIDAAGRVHPYRRPLSLRNAAGPARRVSAESLGGARGSRPATVALIVVTRFSEAATFQPRQLSPGRTLLALLRHTVAARARAESALPYLGAVAAGARAIQGVRGEAEETAALLLSR